MRRSLRLAAAAALLLGGAAAALFGALCAFGPGFERTIARSREIERTFQETARVVDAYRARHRRLPANAELGSDAMSIQDGAYPAEAVRRLGAPPKGSYLLVYWRGEWEEYYAPWSGKSTLNFDESKYYVLGSKRADGGLLLGAGLLLLWLAKKLFPSHNPA